MTSSKSRRWSDASRVRVRRRTAPPPNRKDAPITHDAILGFSYDDNGKTIIHTTTLRMLAGAKLRRYESLLESDLDPGARDIA